MRYRDLCPIEDLPTRTDDQILDLWTRVGSGGFEEDDEWFRALCRETWTTRTLTPTMDIHGGELHFPVSEDDMHLINQKSLDPWVQPNPDRDDFSYILGYAQSFAGYDYAQREGFDLGEFANEHAKEYSQSGKLPSDFIDLRCCLFYEIRRQRHAGLYDNNWRYIQALFKAVCQAYEAEMPSRAARLAEFNAELKARIESLDRGEGISSEEALRHFQERTARRKAEIRAARHPEP